MDEAAYMLKAIANETRLKVIERLRHEEEMTVSELMKELNCEQSLLSHHLTDMRAKGILGFRKEGKNSYYSLRLKEIANILDCIAKCKCN
jgi:ArsR family transcriptional regulator